ncbi:MAG: hypothetical protein QOF90_189 [Acetobacteraceae bacterium]|jgi:hypothetical protein|nr:hypothetical protein [Acetobacteraceae bacterium]
MISKINGENAGSHSFRWMIILSSALLGSASGSALANCDTSSLSGLYATKTQGSVVGVFDSAGALHPLTTPQLVSGVGQVTFDGTGSFVRQDVAVNSGVVLGSPAPLSDTGFRTGQSGTYMVAADCTGTISLSVPGGTTIDFAAVLADSGRNVIAVVNKEHVPALPPAIVPAGASCDAGVGCAVGVNVLVEFTKVFTGRR